MQPIDQGAILRSGALLIFDLQAQMAQQQQIDVQRQNVGLQAAKFQQEQFENAREQATLDSYAADITAIGNLPVSQQPQAIAALIRKYPKQSEALKRSLDAQDQTVKEANFRAAGEIYSLLQNGAPDKAAAKLRQRIEADRAAGQDTSDDEAILGQLESGDPEQVQKAASLIGWQLSASAGPDKFASTYGAINDRTEFEKQYEYIKREFGEDEADNFARNKYDPFVESNNKYGTTFYRSSDLAGGGPAPQRGSTGTGGNVSGGKGKPVADAKAVARDLFPNIAITSGRRDPNSALGRANPKSFHNSTDAAIDVKPIPGMSFSDYVKRYRDAGYTILEARNEVGKGRSPHATGDHWHVVLGGGPQSGPVRVTSKAQYDKLASGAEFIAPDGSRRRKP